MPFSIRQLFLILKLDSECNDSSCCAGFEVLTAATMKNVVFCDVAPCRSYVNLRFGGTYRLHLQGRKIRETGSSVTRYQQTCCHLLTLVPQSRIFFTLKMEAISSSDT
jgi:hypothetical protein